ncbi:MAG: restriction endonuclease [Sideroxyarcus sp.]|nr:restriction endonuclease [Sideroxyarcus sp.]
MRRKRGKKYLLDDLVRLPWQFSMAVGFIIFALMRWVVPSVFSGNPFLKGIVSILASIAWLPLAFFSLVGFMAFAFANRASDDSAIVSAASPVLPKNPLTESIPGFGNSTRTSEITAPEKFEEWTLLGLRKLEWKRFELLCAAYYEAVGFKSETLRCGADGGIDVKLFKGDSKEPIAVVQCKAWNRYQVGVKEIRELLGVMAHERVRRGVFMTTSVFTIDATKFGDANPIQLLDGAAFVSKLRELPKAQQDALLNAAFSGDYETPTCASCGIKTVKRESKRGPFWGCRHYPRCRTKFPLM